MSVQQFCLRWNNHQPNFISVFSSLLHNETLVDVTLAAEGSQLQAHKVVLSACSTYFESLFTLNPCKHPIVILKDVRYSDLKTLVDFMYYGEVNVSQERLPHIIKTAEMLKIKGLAEMSDAASLSKSDSKSSSGGGDQLAANVNDGESVWGHESHHQQQQQQQQQQFHQQSQLQQQQQQQQHHHHQAQQQNRRTPSPNTMSPATRRKRLRKSSTGPEFALRKDLQQQQQQAPPPQYTTEEEFRPSGVTSSSGEEHSSMEGLAIAAGGSGTPSSGLVAGNSVVSSNIHIGHLDTIASFGSSAAAASNLTTTVQNQRLHKESANTDHHHQHHHHHHDTSQESVDDQQQHIVLKTETHELQQQSMPLDITTSSSAGQACPTQAQQHSGVQWTVVESGYPRFALCQSSIGMSSGGGGGNQNNNSNASSSNNNNNGATTGGAQQQQHHHHQQQQQQAQQQQQHQSATDAHHHQHNNTNNKAMGSKRGRLLIRQPRVKRDGEVQILQHVQSEEMEYVPQFNLLRVPHRIERHASEPAPNTFHLTSSSAYQAGPSSSANLLAVPMSTSAYLVKQHSHPLLPSQQSGSMVSVTATSSGHPSAATTTIQRQHSQPTGYHHHHHRQQPHFSSGSNAPVNIILSTSSPSSSPLLVTTSSESVTLPPNLTHFISAQLKSASAEEPLEFGGGRLRTSTPPLLVVPDTMTGSLEYVSSIRVKSDELKRSISTPQTQTREFSLDNPRSSHCPAVRPGPALGCNFCWNTIDTHGRILRRKTKYHCPECQTNLCIVPCFQEYHERQTNEAAGSVPSTTTVNTPATTTLTSSVQPVSGGSSLESRPSTKSSMSVVPLTLATTSSSSSDAAPLQQQPDPKPAAITLREFSKTGSSF